MMLQLSLRFGSAFAAAALLGTVLFALPSTALAQASPAPAARSAPMARVEARIKSLHHDLQITAGQEPQWQAVAEVMRDNAKTIHALIDERRANAATMTAVDDMHAYEAIADAHAAGLKKLTAAFETLYASLSDAQKKKADAAFRARRPMPPKKSG